MTTQTSGVKQVTPKDPARRGGAVAGTRRYRAAVPRAASRRPTSNDVARLAGVSQATVSRTFRGDPRVVDATRAKVLAAAGELGYYPDPIARTMVTARSGVVAVTVPDVENPVFTSMVTALHETLQARELKMMLFLERNFEAGPHDVLGVSGLPVDGVVLASANRDSPVVRELIGRRIPTVLMQRDVEGAAVGRVMPDDAMGCLAVAEHLVGLGHRRIGMITGSPQTSSGSDRHRRFVDALEGLGVAVAERDVRVSSPSFSASVAPARDLLDSADRPTALFCSSDAIAVSVLNVARSLGIDVPGELSVVGFDDIAMASWPMLDLTTVRQPVPDQCEAAVRLLLAQIEGDPEPRTEVFPVELVVRGTTAPPRR